MHEDPLLKDQVGRFKTLGSEHSFIISPMMERKRFIQQSENLFDEDSLTNLNETLPEINKEDMELV